MNSTKTRLQFQCGCILVFLGLIFLQACVKTCPNVSNRNDVYEYPVKPGSERWKALRNHEEMLEACQIPDDILKNISTAGLVETVLSYPMYGDMLLLSSNLEKGLEIGFAVMSDRFNGFSELYKRKDARALLLARYRGMDPALKQGDYIFNFIYIEALLLQKPILSSLTAQQRQELREVALEKYRAKKAIDSYGKGSLRITLSLADAVAALE